MSLGETVVPGHFYLVGVGPGAPDLLTLRALNTIRACDVLIAPRSETSRESLALQVVEEFVGTQEVIEHTYPMERSQQQTERCWARMADIVVDRCQRGQSVAHLTIGDPLLYSTAGYLIDQIVARLPGERWHVVPGISAFQASAAIAQQPLTRQNDRLMLMPATSISEVEQALDVCETLALYKVGPRLKQLSSMLGRHNLASRSHLVCHASQEGKETVLRGLDSISDDKAGYMSTVIVPMGHRSWTAVEPER
jgi:precorrin-2/cobalt-factor-2 C20-methyltransferase